MYNSKNRQKLGLKSTRKIYSLKFLISSDILYKQIAYAMNEAQVFNKEE